MANVDLDIKQYELMLILSGEIPEVDFEKELQEIRKLLQENTKGVSHEENWGKRELFYRIKRQPRAYYAVFVFRAEPERIVELRTNIKLNPAVLRHLLISVPESYDSVKAKNFMFREMPAKESEKRELVREAPSAAAVPTEEAKPTKVAGKKEEEELKKVEKKLEEILDNPDIDIR